MRKTITLSVIAAALLACVKDRPAEMIGPGESLPGFAVETLDGATVSDKDLTGAPSLIILFTTTCPDCHRQLPEVEAAHASLKGKARFLAIAREERKETVSVFWEENGFTFPAAAPGDRGVYNLFDRGSRSGVPQVYLSGADGKVIATANDKRLMLKDEIIKILSE